MSHIDQVQFERPNLDKLNSKYTVVDLHFHSLHSDGLNHIDKIAEKGSKLGIGIAITDHNEICGALEMERYKDVFSIPGIELTAAEGSHLLVYFYDTDTLERYYENEVLPFIGQGVMSSINLPMHQILKRSRRYPCVIIFAHPYCALYTGICNLQFSQKELRTLFKMADGVEVLNGSNLNKWNLKCTVLGFNLGKSMVGGSDGHALSHMGRAVTYARCDKSRRAFLNAVRKRKNFIVGKEIDLFRKMTSNSLKMRSNLNNCPDLMEKHFRYSCKVINFKSRKLRSNVKRRLNAHINSANFRSYFGM